VSDYADAFKEVFDAVQPDSDPVLSYGDGETPDPEKELDRIIERCKTATWEASTDEEPVTIRYGEKRVPTVGNGHVYQAKQGGVTGTTEPSWGVSDYSRVSDGTVVWEEAGVFVGNTYDTRAAKYAALDMKLSKTGEYTGAEEERIVAHLEKMRARYAPVGIA
jgi:hypothetical protein